MFTYLRVLPRCSPLPYQSRAYKGKTLEVIILGLVIVFLIRVSKFDYKSRNISLRTFCFVRTANFTRSVNLRTVFNIQENRELDWQGKKGSRMIGHSLYELGLTC